MPDIVTLGEALIDLVSTQSGVSLSDAPAFIRAAGGAPANVAVALARLGTKTGFIGKVGRDQFGVFLRRTLTDEGVDTGCLYDEPRARTALAFVSLRADGERDFVFYRNPGADMLLSEEDISASCFEGCSILHFGSLSLTDEPARRATHRAWELARSAGALLSCDPNIRLSLWPDMDTALEQITDALKASDIVKVSRDELLLITGRTDLREGTDILLDMGPKLLTVTLGPRGCYYRTKNTEGRVEGFSVEVVDATGAGDAFVAGVIAGLLPHIKAGRGVDSLQKEEYHLILRLANAVGALVTTSRGVIPSLPTRAEVLQLMNNCYN